MRGELIAFGVRGVPLVRRELPLSWHLLRDGSFPLIMIFGYGVFVGLMDLLLRVFTLQ